MSRPAFTPLTQEFKDREMFANAFISTIFPHNASGFIELRAICPKGYASQQWYSRNQLPAFGHYLRNHDDCHIYFGVATRTGKGSGAAHNCLNTYSLPLDADCKTPERAAEFKAQLSNFPLPPTIFIATGSPFSYHVHWSLASPLSSATQGDLYSRTVAGLAAHFSTDNVSDIPRVMRLVGSRNVKSGTNGPVVKMTLLKPERRYRIEDFGAYVLESQKQVKGDVNSSHSPTPGRLDLLFEFHKRGWLLEDQGGHFYYVRCPWKEQHSSESGKSETALWRYGSMWCFKCLHSHCARRKARECAQFFTLMQAATAEVR